MEVFRYFGEKEVMSIRNQVVRTVEHNSWANSTFIEWLSAKDEEIIHRETASSCPTILATLTHLWEAQEYWTSVVGETSDITRVWEMENPAKGMVFEGLAANSKRLVEIVSRLSEDELSAPHPIKNQWLDCALPKAEYLQQVVGHGLYHRGQIVTMARGFGITDPPMTDFIVWATR